MSYSEDNTFEKIMERALANDVLNNIDKREGSIIYDAIAPMALELANLYALLDIMDEQSTLLTATGINLERKCYEFGINRTSATYALRIASFKQYKTDSSGAYIKDDDGNKILVDMSIPVDSRFAVPGDNTITYRYIGIRSGNYIVQCEQGGSKGNLPVGTILPLTPITGLAVAEITGTLVPAEDTETDDALRQRTIDHINYPAFGGNIPDYIEKTNAIDGVGETKVFPAWRNNGSVLLSIVDGDKNPVSNEFITYVKGIIDPEENTGGGTGTAPIGHYVTVTTPERFPIDVEVDVSVEGNDVDSVYYDCYEIIDGYISEIRKKWSQEATLYIIRARIIERILANVPQVINVTEVLLNGVDNDITIVDEARVGGQYLPYTGEVTVR